jgi:signal transduction histidine kinase
VTLVQWLERLLSGPWDEAYFEARCRIGRYHVRIGLPQHYMFGAMSVVRRELGGIVREAYWEKPELHEPARLALGRILDIELAIMLHTYREDLLAQQARVERLSTFGQLAASIGHELRNPLAVIEGALHLLRRATDAGRIVQLLDRAEQHLGIANGVITGLLDMVREKPLARGRVAMDGVVAEAASSVANLRDVRYAAEGLADLVVEGDSVQLRQVFVNLLTNAVEASPRPEDVRVCGSRCPVSGQVVIAVEDTGPGVDAATARRLFEPLTTTKKHGTGLGLALVKQILERHGGSIAYEPRAGGGARFTVRLPRGPQASA